MSDWAILFWLVASFLIMHPLNRWINTRIQGVALLITGSPKLALWFFWVIFVPGTFLHEASHWVTAHMLGVRTGGFSVWPKASANGQLQMGAVQIEIVDPFRHSLIGIAPLIFGSIAVSFLGRWLALDNLGVALTSGNWDRINTAITATLAVPDVWLWLYLLFAIANAMLPSASDRESWQAMAIYLSLGLVLAVGLGLNPFLWPQLQQFSLLVMGYLLSAFMMTIFVNVLCIMVLVVLENTVSWVLGRRVQYNYSR